MLKHNEFLSFFFQIDDSYPRPVAYWWYGCSSSNMMEGPITGDLMLPEPLMKDKTGEHDIFVEGEMPTGSATSAAPMWSFVSIFAVFTTFKHFLL